MRIAERGVRNFLSHAGILAGEVERRPTVQLEIPDGDGCVISMSERVIEMCRDLGAEVEAGQTLARAHPLHRTGVEPVIYRARISGLLGARHFPGLIKPGDCLAVIAVRRD